MYKIYKYKVDKRTNIIISISYLLATMIVLYIAITQLSNHNKIIILLISLICLISNIFSSRNILKNEKYIYITIENDKIEINKGICKNTIIYKPEIKSIYKSNKTIIIESKTGQKSKIYISNITIKEQFDFENTILKYIWIASS